MPFQSTQPKRAATGTACTAELHECYFNPRSPRGLRLSCCCSSVDLTLISIHAAQEGCDCLLMYRLALLKNFNPRSPRGLRRKALADLVKEVFISIHAAQEGCDMLYYK